MTSTRAPLTREQRFALRAICIAGTLMALLSIVGLIFLRGDATTRSRVIDVALVVCGGVMAGVSGRRLRVAARR